MLSNWINLFFPRNCLICSESLFNGEEWICTICSYALLQTDYHEYPDNPVFRRLAGRIPLEHGMALYQFRRAGKAQKLIYHLKYQQKPDLGKWLGQAYGKILKRVGLDSSFDLIIPVPLHDSKIHQRGYNQSDYFAWGLSESLGIAWHSKCLTRVLKTSTQTSKSQTERFSNVEHAFRVTDKNAIYNQRLLLVDDVITTGATLEACSVVLLAAEAQCVSIATIAATT